MGVILMIIIIIVLYLERLINIHILAKPTLECYVGLNKHMATSEMKSYSYLKWVQGLGTRFLDNK